jgi:hypothetical protein
MSKHILKYGFYSLMNHLISRPMRFVTYELFTCTRALPPKKSLLRPGMVVHICNPSIQGTEIRQEDHEVEVSLGYTVRPCRKKKSFPWDPTIRGMSCGT